MEPEKDNKLTVNVEVADDAPVVNEKMASKNLDKQKEPKRAPKEKLDKRWLVFLVFGLLLLLGGLACILYCLLRPQKEVATLSFPDIPSTTQDNATYSKLTGLPLEDVSLINAPAYCIQVPNGADGARPQSGLNEAGVIFEAIAEAGITRFAAIFQNPTPAVIGPIRSLRLYYLEWDTPFDCTIVHAGGADDALRAVATGGYKDMTENYTYMYRGTYGARRWNNLFVTSADLKRFSSDHGYDTSDIKGFTRMTPEESRVSRVDNLVTEKLEITTPAKGNTSELVAKTPEIRINFGNSATYNVVYKYNAENNTYERSYGVGPHEVYNCPHDNLGQKNPEDACSLTVMSPSAVVAMVVSERKASDNYHEDITTIGSGDAYIFQNGTVFHGSWNKASRADQIKFLDSEGNEIKLTPGQTIVSAVPQYGKVDY